MNNENNGESVSKMMTFEVTLQARWRDTALRVVTFIIFILGWEIIGRSVSPADFAPFSEVAIGFYDLAIASPLLVEAVIETLVPFVAGYVAACIVGIIVGFTMGRFRPVEYVLDPYVSILYGIPGIALIPVLVIWLGIGATLRFAIVFMACVFSVIITTMQGVKHIDRGLIDVGVVSCASESQILRRIVLPASLPYIFAAFQIALGQALIGIIVAEMTAVLSGLGRMVLTYAAQFKTAEMLVPILTVAGISIALTQALKVARRFLMPWETP